MSKYSMKVIQHNIYCIQYIVKIEIYIFQTSTSSRASTTRRITRSGSESGERS